jgi:high-affinity iron transporter
MMREATTLGKAVADGRRPLFALTLVVGAAVLREGSETVLFVYGVSASSSESASSMILGGMLGIAGGVAIGAALYAGLLRMPIRRLFAVTGWMVLLLAAGLAAQAVSFMVQADLLPPLGQEAWDTSWLLTDTSIVGRVLHTLIGYVARPQGIQVIAFVATLLAIGLPMRLISRQGPPPKGTSSQGIPFKGTAQG